MPRKKGTEKTGGRKRGSINKTTALRRRVDVLAEVRALYGKPVDSYRERWVVWMSKDPAGFAEFLVQLYEGEARKLRMSLEMALRNRRVIRPENLDWVFSRYPVWADTRWLLEQIEDHIDLKHAREARAESAERIPFEKIRDELLLH